MENQIQNMCCGRSKPGMAIVGILIIALAVYVLALAFNAIKANKYIGRDAMAQSTVSVAGTGDVMTKPDLALMDFSVVSSGKTVAEAMADNTKKMNAIVDVTKSLGVADNDLQTSSFNISPHYDYVKQSTPIMAPVPAVTTSVGLAGSSVIPVDSSIYYPNGKQVLSGYDITQTLTVKVRDLTKIGQIIEETTAAGANQVGDLQFTVDNPDAVQAQARKIAIDDAKTKAQVLAKQLGVKLVRITSYSEGGYYPVAYSAKAMGGGASDSVAVPNIQTGENKITVNVNVTYEIE